MIPNNKKVNTEQETQNTNISNKVDKVEGKGLSTNDYSTEEKQKLAGLQNYDDKKVQDELNTKANSNDVYTKTQLDDNLLPMERMKGLTIGDKQTVTFQVENNRAYLFVNTHINNREIVLITQRTSQSVLNLNRILSVDSNYLTSFSFKDGKITINGSINCRGIVYKLNYQYCA